MLGATSGSTIDLSADIFILIDAHDLHLCTGKHAGCQHGDSCHRDSQRWQLVTIATESFRSSARLRNFQIVIFNLKC